MSMRILNWNTEFASPRAKSDKFERIRETISAYGADVILPKTERGSAITTASALMWRQFEP